MYWKVDCVAASGLSYFNVIRETASFPDYIKTMSVKQYNKGDLWSVNVMVRMCPGHLTVRSTSVYLSTCGSDA